MSRRLERGCDERPSPRPPRSTRRPPPRCKSPEQLEGKEADARTDLFAFGAIVYEMLTGRKAFEGTSQASLISAIMSAQPPAMCALEPLTPPLLDHIVQRCLAKDPDARWQSARDLEEALRWVGESGRATAVTGQASVPAARRQLTPWVIAAVAVLAAVALAVPAALYVRRAGPIDAPEIRLEVVTPTTSDAISLAISPDGRRLVFVASGDAVSRLWLRPLDVVTAQPLPGTENATYPFWSPDSRSIGFFAGGKLKRIDLGGGSPQTLANAPSTRGGAWSRDGIILFAPGQTGGLSRVPASGGEAAAVTRLAPGQVSHRFPFFLPNGRQFLFFMQGSAETQGIYLGALDSANPIRLAAADTAAAYVPPGYVLYVRQGTLVARSLDATRGVLTGDPMTVADPVGFDAGFNVAAFSVSAAGPVAYRTGAVSRRQLTWFDRTGRPVGTVAAPDENGLLYPELSPDGHRVAVSRAVEGNTDVWLIDVMRGVRTRFTFDGSTDSSPIWSPDGSRIAFRSSRKGAYDLYQKPSSGAGDEVALLASPQSKYPADWSPDGRVLLYQNVDAKSGNDLWVLPLDGNRQPVLFLQTAFDESEGQFSPDGHWVAYQSNESGRFEIDAQPFPGPGGKFQVSTGGGIQPRWRRDGQELFYIAPDGKLMAVPIRLQGSTLEAGTPVALFQTRTAQIAQGAIKQQYAVAADGRFLVNDATEESATSPITVILNWKPRAKSP